MTGPETNPGRRGPGWRFTEWLFGVVGGIATFLGLFILFAGDDHSVGIGGALSWRVGDISAAWGYGLLIGGVLLLIGGLVMAVPSRGRVEGDRRRTDLGDLLWHAGIFIVVNAFIWVQNIAVGGGVDYAYWVTTPWAIGLATHTAVYLYRRRHQEAMPEAPLGQEPKELQRR